MGDSPTTRGPSEGKLGPQKDLQASARPRAVERRREYPQALPGIGDSPASADRMWRRRPQNRGYSMTFWPTIGSFNSAMCCLGIYVRGFLDGFCKSQSSDWHTCLSVVRKNSAQSLGAGDQAHPQALHPPGSAAAELPDVAGIGSFIPLGRQERPELAATSPPIPGDFGGFTANGGTFEHGAGRDCASPVTTRVSAPGKVYI